jgi:hypothetical protein
VLEELDSPLVELEEGFVVEVPGSVADTFVSSSPEGSSSLGQPARRAVIAKHRKFQAVRIASTHGILSRIRASYQLSLVGLPSSNRAQDHALPHA